MKTTNCKMIKDIVLIKVQNARLTTFYSAIERELFIKSHPDAEIFKNYAKEPLYVLVDTDVYGFILTPKFGITYNEAIDLINRYY